MMKLPLLSSVFLVTGLAACGGHVGADPAPLVSADSGVSVDSGTLPVEDTMPAVDTEVPPTPDVAPPLDHGAPSKTYPAFPPDAAQLVNQGGDVLTAPVLVTVTYPGETNVDAYESFGDHLGDTSYWKAITAEYGVKPTVSGAANHVRMTTALPAAMDDSEVDTYVHDRALDPTKYGWPAPTDQTIYVIYVPSTTAITLQGNEACSSGVGGYHSSTTVGSLEVAYAIVLQCDYGGHRMSPRTVTASHEVAEASLDPHPLTSTPGYRGMDTDHLAWEIFMQRNVENGDLCEIYNDSRYSDTVDPGFTFNVQRQWSNQSGKAGHNPCAPVSANPYFNVVALEQEKVTMNATTLGGSGRQATKGFHVGVGETKTFAIGFWSDRDTGGPWQIKATEGSPFGTKTTVKRLTTSIDRGSGTNGEKAYVTVTVNSVSSTKASVLTIVSTSGSQQFFMPILISSQ